MEPDALGRQRAQDEAARRNIPEGTGDAHQPVAVERVTDPARDLDRLALAQRVKSGQLLPRELDLGEINIRHTNTTLRKEWRVKMKPWTKKDTIEVIVQIVVAAAASIATSLYLMAH